MGKEFLEAKKERYNRKMDQERLKQLGANELLDALAEQVNKLLRFKCHDDADPAVGTVVFLAITPSHSRAQVYQGGAMVCIGEVDDAGTRELVVLAARHPACRGAFNATVTSSKDWTGYVQAQLDPLT